MSDRVRRGGPRRGRLALGAIVGLHLLLGLSLGLNTPLFESPDEPGHYLFVRYLQAHQQLPVQTAQFMAPRAHHPPGYYVLGALLTGWVSIPGSPSAIQMQTNPHFGFRPDDPGNDNKAFYLQNTPDARFPYQGQALAVHLLRLISLAFGLVAVLATYGAARELRPEDERFAWLAAGLLALNPMALFMTGLVNNDTTALAAGAVVAYLVARTVRRGFTPGRWAVVGAAWGVGLLLKTSVLVLAAPIALALSAEAWRARSAWRLIVGGLMVAAPVAALAGWWFIRNWGLYGDPLGNAAMLLVNGRVPAGEGLANLPSNLSWFFEGVVGCGPIGPLGVCFPTWVYPAAELIGVAAAAGLVRLAAHACPGWSRARWGSALQTPAAAAWGAQGVLVAGTFAAAVSYGLSYKNGWQGRYLFPAYASGALLVAAGLLAIVPARWRNVTTGITLAASLALSAYGLFGLVIPRYGIPPAASASEIKQATAVEAQVDEVARVVGYHVDTATAHPGGVLAVTVYWQVLARTAQPYTVFIHLYAPETGSIAQRDTYPGLGNYATSLWDPGRIFADTYRIYLPPDAPNTAKAMILLGLYDAASGQRLPVTGPAAGPTEDAWAQFGAVTVEP